MFLLYSLWGLFYVFFSYTHLFIENFFFIKNNPFLIRKRTFKYISYFERLLLIFFHRSGWFEKSIANLYRKKDILDYRRNYYPVIYSFHINHNKVYYEINDLKFFSKQFKYFYKSSILKKKLNKVLNLCFKKNNKLFIKYLVLQNLFISYYFNLNSYFNFKNKSKLNLIKLNRLFHISLIRSTKKFIIFNLDKWYDWYDFNFNRNNLNYCNKKIKLTKQQQKKIKDFKNKKIFKWINVVFKYKKLISKFYFFFLKKFSGIIHFKFSYLNFFKVRVNKDFYKLLKYYIIKFSESSVNKHIKANNLKNYNLQFLRKNRIFNKGRYSRNRQLYRTGVYWCLWLNIIMVYGLYFIFYRFSFNFGYFWWGILFLAYSTIFSRIVKYNFFNIYYVFIEFNNLIKWYGSLINNLLNYIEFLLINYFIDISLINHIAKYKNDTLSFFYNSYYFYFIKFFKKLILKRKKTKIGYFWQGMKEKDKSFLRYKTVIHWIKEIYRLIIT